MTPDCEHIQQELISNAVGDNVSPDHLSTCADCRTVAAVERRLAPPSDLVSASFLRVAPLLRQRAADRRTIFWRMTLAGALSLPFIVVLNVAMLWTTYVGLEHYTSPTIAAVATTVMATSLLLTLSLAYGSLPLLANWGVHIRERAVA